MNQTIPAAGECDGPALPGRPQRTSRRTAEALYGDSGGGNPPVPGQAPPAVPGQQHTGWWCEHFQAPADSYAPCPRGCLMIPVYKWTDERMREAFESRPIGPVTAEEASTEKRKLLWACQCGRGGIANLVFYCDEQYARAEVERQVAEHLLEDGHDWLHAVHVGTFAESFTLDAPPSRALLWREAGMPDAYGPHPRLS